MTGNLFSKKKRNPTSRSTSTNAERRAADFHAPGEGRRTPLSGSNSGHTHADCMYIPGLFIEAKLRASHAVWTLYRKTRDLAKKESLVPVVTLFKKYEKGFLDCVHSDFIDVYVERMTENRRIKVNHPHEIWYGEAVLYNLYEGAPSEVEFVLNNLKTFSFNNDGTLKPDWNKVNGDGLELWVIVKSGFTRTLYGRFKYPFKKRVYLESLVVRKAMG
jgi:hypothetical protein